MKSVPAFSALHVPPIHPQPPSTEKTAILNWILEPDLTSRESTASSLFTQSSGQYTAPTDGLYTIIVQLIPVNGAPVAIAPLLRSNVDYAVRLNLPNEPDSSDAVQSSFLDVGSLNFGQVVHLKANTHIACIQMPGAHGRESVRLKIELIQRKRKRYVQELTRKQIKSRRKEKRKLEAQSRSTSSSILTSSAASVTATVSPTSPSSSIRDQSDSDNDISDDSDDSEWETGFDSDTTADELPHSQRGVGRLAKRFKSSASPSSWL